MASIKSISARDSVGARNIGKSGEVVSVTLVLDEVLTARNGTVNGKTVKPSFMVGTQAITDGAINFVSFNPTAKTLVYELTIPAGINGNEISLTGVTLSNISLAGKSSAFSYNPATPLKASYRVDSSAPEFTSASTLNPIPENSIASRSPVYTAVATDNSGIKPSYSLAGRDAALFAIDKAGVVRLKANPDFETRSVYSFSVIATDAAGNTAEKALSLNVTNIDEAVTLAKGVSGVGNITVARGALASQAKSVVSDFVNDAGGVMSFSATGLPAGISLQNGTLTGTAPLLRPFRFTVRADDGVPNGVDASRQYQLVVVDTPVVTGIRISDADANNSGKQGNAVNIKVFLSEIVTPSSATLTGISANFSAGRNALTNVAINGISTEDNVSVLNFSAILPAGESSTITMNSLNLSNIGLLGTISGKTTNGVINNRLTAQYLVDNSAPKITSAATVTINENLSIGSVIYQAKASDLNAVTYRLTGAATSLFNIDATSGNLSLTGAVDYERLATSNYRYGLNIVATDSNGNSSSKPLTVIVRDVNEPTQLAATASPSATYVVYQNSNVSFSVPTLANQFVDPEKIVKNISYRVTDGWLPAGLTLNAKTGAITGYISETADSYRFSITADDGVANGADASVNLQLDMVNKALLKVSDNHLTNSENSVILTAYGKFAPQGKLQLFKQTDNTQTALGNIVTLGSSSESYNINYQKSTLAIDDNANANFFMRYTSPSGATVDSITVNISRDSVAPSISAIGLTSTQAQNGTLNAGDIVTATVTFSESVSVKGTPSINLQVGAATKVANFSDATGSLVNFIYTVLAADTDADGVSIAADSVSGGTILDMAGNSAMLSHAALSARNDIKVDNQAPSVSTISLAASGGVANLLNAGDVVTASVTFAEDIVVSTAPTVTAPSLNLLVGSATRTATYADRTGYVANFVYTIQASDSDADGISINANSLAGNAITDLAGNLAVITHTAVSAQSGLQVDNVIPSVTSLSLSAANGVDGVFNIGDVVTANATFSENMSVSATPTINLLVGSSSRPAAFISSAGSVVQFEYTIQSGDTDSDGVSINADSFLGVTIADLAGNAANLSHIALPANPAIKVDGVAPSITGFALSSAVTTGFLRAGDVVTATATFSEAMNISGTPSLDVLVGSSTRTAVFSSASGSTAQFTYTILAADADTQGISIAAGTLTNGTLSDSAGNSAVRTYSALTHQAGFKVDNIAPSITSLSLSSTDARNDFLNATDVVTANVTFSEAINVTGSPSLSLMVGSTARSASFLSSSGSVAKFVYTVEMADSDSNGISISANSLAGGTITDLASNSAVITHTALADQTAVKVDNAAPSVSGAISLSASGAQNNFLNASDVVTATVTFNEAIAVTGHPTLNIALGTATATATFSSVSGSTALFVYTVAAGDTDTDGISISADSIVVNASNNITDLAGNNATVTHASVAAQSTLKVDTQAPNAPVFTGVTGGNLNSADDSIYVKTRNPVLAGTAEAGATVKVVDGSNTSLGTVVADASGNWTLALSNLTEGAFAAPKATALDAAQNESSVGTGKRIVVDTIPPTIAVSSPQTTLLAGQTASIVFTLSEDSADFTSSDVSVAGGTLTNFAGSGRNYTATFVPTRNSTVLGSVTVSSSKFTDFAGNFNSDGSDSNNAALFTVNTVAPGISSIALSSPDGQNDFLNAGDVVTATVTFDTTVTISGTPTLNLLVGSASKSMNHVSNSTSVVTFTYTISAGDTDTDGVSIASDNFGGAIVTNASGNTAVLMHDSVSATTLKVDTQAPSISSLRLSSSGAQNNFVNLNDVVTASVTFAETVSINGSPTLDLEIGSSTKQAVFSSSLSSGSVANFVYTIAASDTDADGISIIGNSLALASGTIKDLAGNSAVLSHNVLSNQTGVKVDTQNPTLSGVSLNASGAQADFLNAGDVLTANVTFSEALAISGTPSLLLHLNGVGKTARYSSALSSGSVAKFVYTIQPGDNDSNGTTLSAGSISLNAGSITDLAGNAPTSLSYTAIASDSTLKVDTVAPSITNLSMTAGGTPISGRLNVDDTVIIRATFNEVVTTTASPSINITINSITQTVPLSSITGSIAEFIYTVKATDNEPSAIGLLQNSITSGFVDLAGNTAASPLVPVATNIASLVIDNTTPTVEAVSVSASGGSQELLNAGDIVTATVTFSEAMSVSTLTANPTLNLIVGSATKAAVFNNVSGSLVNFLYTIQAGDNDSDGLSIHADSIVLNGGVITDIAGNTALLPHASLAAQTFTKVDTVQPSINSVGLISIANGNISDNTLLAGAVIRASVRFSEAISVSGTPKISLLVGTESKDANFKNVAGSVAHFEYTIQSGDDDSNGISINANSIALSAGAITDIAGNDALISHLATTSAFIVDAKAPTISSIAFAGNRIPSNGFLDVNDVITATVTFSEAVNLTTTAGVPSFSFAMGSATRSASFVSLSNNSVATFTYTIQAGDNDVDGVSAAADSFSLNGAVITDLATNPAVLTLTGLQNQSSIKVDTAVPSIVDIQLSATGARNGFLNAMDVVNGTTTPDVLTVSVIFSEAVTASVGAHLPILVGANTRQANFLDSIGTTIRFTYTIVSGDNDADGISIPANAVFADSNIEYKDIAGKDVPRTHNAVADNALFRVDTVLPTNESTLSFTDTGSDTSDKKTSDNRIFASNIGPDGLIEYQVDGAGPWLPGTNGMFGAELGDNTYIVRQVDLAGNFGPSSSPIRVDYQGIAQGYAIYGGNEYDGLGISVSSIGDLNGDGLTDMVVGANQSDVQGKGIAYVVYGKNSAGQILASNLANGTGGFVINAETSALAASGALGNSVSGLGDINGDGLADFAVAAPGYSGGQGRAYVVFGKTNNSAVNLADVVEGSGGFVLGWSGAGGQASSLGNIIVSNGGDVNGDGLADILIGSETRSRAYVVFGKSNGGAVDLNNLSASGFVINAVCAADGLGVSLSSIGDMNGDGLTDLLIGANNASSQKGRSYVVFGKTSSTNINLTAVANGTGGFVINGQCNNDFSGQSVSAAGDVNGDGIPDLLIGVAKTFTEENAKLDAYVVYGKTNNTDPVNLSAVAVGTGGFIIKGESVGDNTVISVSSAGDVNGDGLADVIIEAGWATRNGIPQVGVGYVVFGKSANNNAIEHQ